MEPADYNLLKIKEHSPLARVARMVLKSSNVAMVIGSTIHLSGVSKEAFLRDRCWVEHELCHVRQFREHGFLRFLWLYLLESCRKGYYMNKYEVEARVAGARTKPAGGATAGKAEGGEEKLL